MKQIMINQPKEDAAPSPTQPAADHSKNNGRKDILSTLSVIILAPIVALLLTVFVFQSYEVDGPSMETTLADNDRLIITKTGKTWSQIAGNQYIPDRHDIIVFSQTSSDFRGTSKKQLIKRVIGLPGDRVAIKDGKVTVYNSQNPDGFLVDESGPQAGSIGYTDGNLEQLVKEGQVFVLGDNRGNSLDSRSFGAVGSEDIIGTLSVRIYPFNTIDKF